MDHPTTSASPIPIGKLAVGVALLVVGILSFTDYIDAFDMHEIWRFWPLLLIFIGLSTEFDALRQRRRSGGYILVAVGVWLLVANEHIFGFSHRSAMPLGIAVVGLGLIVHALIDDPNARRERRHDRS